MSLHRVATFIDDDVSAFELATACEVFGIDRTADGVPPFEFFVCSPRPGTVHGSTGFDLIARHDLKPIETADLVLVPALSMEYQPSAELVRALWRAVERGATVASVCSGSFILARAGLLAGRRATTHWRYVDRLQREFPDIDVVPDVLYIEDGPIATSAGTASGIDLCLHLVRRAHGSAVANAVARRMVVQPHREGGQAQYVTTPIRAHEADTLAPVLDWAMERLHEDLPVARLARHAAMSSRTFARRFQDETGTTPHHWLLAQRVALAERMLETTGAPIEEVAQRSGFGSSTMLRHHFLRLRGTSPTAYRRTFSCVEPAAAGN